MKKLVELGPWLAQVVGPSSENRFASVFPAAQRRTSNLEREERANRNEL